MNEDRIIQYFHFIGKPIIFFCIAVILLSIILYFYQRKIIPKILGSLDGVMDIISQYNIFLVSEKQKLKNEKEQKEVEIRVIKRKKDQKKERIIGIKANVKGKFTNLLAQELMRKMRNLDKNEITEKGLYQATESSRRRSSKYKNQQNDFNI